MSGRCLELFQPDHDGNTCSVFARSIHVLERLAHCDTALVLIFLCGLPGLAAAAPDRFYGYNQTTSTDFSGVFLAPEGTQKWGPNEALNDKDKTWEAGERLPIKSASRARFDLKIVDHSGRTCIRHGIDLSKDTTFDIRDADLAGCKK